MNSRTQKQIHTEQAQSNSKHDKIPLNKFKHSNKVNKMANINFNFPYVADPDKGTPIAFCQLFVGIPDLDPEIPANQKQLSIIQEDGTLVAVPQPLVFSAGGVPTYNGSTVRLDVDGNYSFKILNSNSELKYYVHNVFEGEPITRIDLINDLSQTINFDDVAAYKAFTEILPVKKRVYLADRDAYFTVIADTGTSNTWNIIASNEVAQSIDLVLFEGITTSALGADITVTNGTGALNAILGLVERVTVDNEITVNELDIAGNTLILLNGGGQINADTVEGDGVGNGDLNYHVTKRIAFSTNAACVFEIKDRLLINCKGARQDGETLGQAFGGNSGAPNFAERAFQFENCKSIVLRMEIFNYLGAGDSITGNTKDIHDNTLIGNFVDVAVVIQDCVNVEIRGKWRNNGSEMTTIRDTNADGSKVTDLLFHARCDDNHRSHLWYMLKSVIVEPSLLTKHEASPINAFSDNQVITSVIIDFVNASHGIDLSEGSILTKNVQIISPMITNVDDSAIYALTIGLKIIGGIIEGANYGIRNLLSFGDTVTDVPGDTLIDGVTIRNVNIGAIQVTGKRAIPEYTHTQITNCKLWQNILLTESFGIDSQSSEDTDITNNVIQGFGKPITMRTRIRRLQITGNTFDQIHGKENQIYDDILIDAENDTIPTEQIDISNNQFKQPPANGQWSFRILNFSSIKDVNLHDNTGYFYFFVDDTSINYRKEYTRSWRGGIGTGTFEGGSKVNGQIRANFDVAYWKFIQYDGRQNFGITMDSNPSSTASTTSGSNVVTMSISSHGIEAGEFINIGTVTDNMVVAVDGVTLHMWKDMTATSSGVVVAYNGNVRTGYLGSSPALIAVI